MSAAEIKTPGGLIVPRSAMEGKSDRSQAASVRSFGSMYGQTTRFREYTDYLQALRIPWVHRCVLTIAQNFANNGWNLKQGDEIVDDPYDPFLRLMERPNPHQTGFRWREMLCMYMELLGEAFITLEARDADGRPTELYLPNPANMTVVPDPTNYIKGYVFNSGGLGPKIPYGPDEVIHIKLPNPMNPYRGFGPVEASADVLDIVKKIVNFEGSWYGSSGRIVGVLETDFEVTDEEFDRIKQDWRAFSADDRQRHKTAILQNGLKYTPVAEGMKNIDVVAINNEKRDTILGNWGVPLTKLGITQGSAEQMREGDQVFWSETMEPKFQRYEEDIQPLVDLFDAARRWEFVRKNFEDDTIRLTNSQKMALTYAFSVDDIRSYNNQDPLPNGAGKVIMVPTQMTPLKLADLADFADAALEVQQNKADPPEPPTPAAPPPGVANLPGHVAVAGVAPAGPGQGAGSGRVGPGAGAKPGANDGNRNSGASKGVGELSTKEAAYLTPDDLVRLAAHPDMPDDVRADLIEKAAQRELGAARVKNRMYRVPKQFRGPGLGEKAITPGNANLPVTAHYIRTRLTTFMDQSRGQAALAGLKRAFRAQRRDVVHALPEIVKAAQGLKAEDRRPAIARSLGEVLSIDGVKRAVAPIHVAGIINGYRTGLHVLPPQRQQIANRRAQTRKSATWEGKDMSDYPTYLAPDAADWRRYAEDFRSTDPQGFATQFDRLQKNIAGVNDTTMDKLADTIEEGLRRGYTAIQIANGNADEGYGGIASVMEDAEDWRAEMIGRTEAREAFNGGAFRSYADADVNMVEAIDGDFDLKCRERNGTRYPFDPATGEIKASADEQDEHPNGSLTWGPVA